MDGRSPLASGRPRVLPKWSTSGVWPRQTLNQLTQRPKQPTRQRTPSRPSAPPARHRPTAPSHPVLLVPKARQGVLLPSFPCDGRAQMARPQPKSALRRGRGHLKTTATNRFYKTSHQSSTSRLPFLLRNIMPESKKLSCCLQKVETSITPPKQRFSPQP